MEYAPGGSLFFKIRNLGPLSEIEAMKMFRQVVSGIDYLHQLDIIHRDLKVLDI